MIEKYFVEGYWTEDTASRLWEKIVLIDGSLLLIKPGLLTDLLKIYGGLSVLVAQAIRGSKDRIFGNNGRIGNCAQ
jgi:UPF0716 family protein affecting phage T7 exclusion